MTVQPIQAVKFVGDLPNFIIIKGYLGRSTNSRKIPSNMNIGFQSGLSWLILRWALEIDPALDV